MSVFIYTFLIVLLLVPKSQKFKSFLLKKLNTSMSVFLLEWHMYNPKEHLCTDQGSYTSKENINIHRTSCKSTMCIYI